MTAWISGGRIGTSVWMAPISAPVKAEATAEITGTRAEITGMSPVRIGPRAPASWLTSCPMACTTTGRIGRSAWKAPMNTSRHTVATCMTTGRICPTRGPICANTGASWEKTLEMIGPS
jgi:hypothetical protein